MSVFSGKQGLVELRGAGSTIMAEAPGIVNQCFRISRIKKNFFCYKGFIDGKTCFFKIDTGSDVSVVSERLIGGSKSRCKIENCFLRYPTGETISVKFRVNVEIGLGKYLLEIPMLVADISDNCILGTDFLEKLKLDKIFESEFGRPEKESGDEFSCSQILEEKVPYFLQMFFEENSKNLSSQRDIFADFLIEFQDVFSEDLVAGNCEVLKHSINVRDSKPIKQAPRRIPLHLREEVEHIREMKQRGVIEESRSPWVSPVVLVKKKDVSLRFCVDYRKLNAVTVKDSYPLPRIEDILDQLSGNSWFSTLDLKSGYWQVKVNSEDKEKTAFSVGNGL